MFYGYRIKLGLVCPFSICQALPHASLPYKIFFHAWQDVMQMDSKMIINSFFIKLIAVKI